MRLVVTAILIALVGAAWAEDPDRARGLSAHFFPKRAAEADKSKSIKWGFMVSTARNTSVAPKDRPVFQSVSGLMGYFKGLDGETRANGIWVVTTNPAAYSSEELGMLEELKRECKAQRIPLFIARGSELPNGWQRQSRIANVPGI